MTASDYLSRYDSEAVETNAQQPEQIYYVPIYDILTQWASCDSGIVFVYSDKPLGLTLWLELLIHKATDKYFRTSYCNIKNNGFLQPLECAYCPKSQCMIMYDGHHRLTAAYVLGYKYVPFYLGSDDWCNQELHHPNECQIAHTRSNYPDWPDSMSTDQFDPEDYIQQRYMNDHAKINVCEVY